MEGEKGIYDAGVEAHNALYNLRIYTGQGGECGDTCPVCHPFSWDGLCASIFISGTNNALSTSSDNPHK